MKKWKFILFLYIIFSILFSKKSYNRNDWFNNKESQYYMINDLLEKEILVGKSKKQAISYIDSNDIKFFKNDDEIWMYIILKPGFVLATDMPIVVLDIYFENDSCIKVERR